MIIFRRRLFFWLIRAYLKKWGRIVAFSFLAGLIIFFLVAVVLNNFSHLLPQRKEVIGLVGAYTVDDLPQFVLSDLSEGLTKVEKDGKVLPNAASSWEIKDNGKTFVFHLRNDLTFVDGEEVTSKEITYEFADVVTERPTPNTIVYKLKNAYSPFLVTASRPIFKDGLNGITSNKVTELKRNGTFVSSLSYVKEGENKRSISYIFYPNQEALKTAFLLGETTQIVGINNLEFNGSSLEDHKNVSVEKTVDYNRLVTLFFDTNNNILSDSTLRRALSYALPDEFSQGERSFLPYPKTSYYANTDLEKRVQDIPHAQVLLDAALEKASSSASVEITLKTLEKYETVAKSISESWGKLGIKTKIETVETVPTTFQAYLGDFSVPRDPDQYTLWHSDQSNNITHFRNLRIDKFLEEGRTTFELEERKKIYNDFQKYLIDEAPATFLYFPYSYTVTRK